MADGGVVERAVRLDVADPGALGPGDAVQRGQLVQDVGGELGRLDVDEPAAEAGEVAVGDLRPDGHARGSGAGAHAAHGRRVAGVEAARHVGAGDEAEQRLVVTQPPDAEALPEVGVEVDGAAHRRSLALRRRADGVRAPA